MKKALLAVFLIGICSSNVFSQTPFAGFEHTHHFPWIQNVHNPAYAGHWTQPAFYATTQFGKNNTSNQQIHNVVYQNTYDKLGIGIVGNYTSLDPSRNVRIGMIGGQASMYFEAFENLQSRAGIGFGALHYNNNSNADAFNELPNNNTAQENNEPFVKLNIDIGILIFNDKFRLGISMIHNNEPEWDFVNADVLFQNNFTGQPASFFLSRYYLINITSRGQTQQGNNADNFRIDANATLSINDEIFIGGTYVLDPNYLANFLVAYRTFGGFQVSGSWSIKRSDVPDNFSQFELGLGWFPEWEEF